MIKITKIPREPNKGLRPVKEVDRKAKNKNNIIEEPLVNDLVGIYRAYNTDGYFRRALDKTVSMMFQNGYKLKYSKPEIYNYIHLRIRLLEQAMDKPFDMFLRSIANHLVTYDNVYLLKHRNVLPNIGRQINTVDADYPFPIVGYELLHPATMYIEKVEKTGTPVRYIQTPINLFTKNYNNNKDNKIFNYNEIIHMVTNYDSVYVAGSYSKTPALNDIRALRTLEDDSAEMEHRFAFPLTHITIENASPEDIAHIARLYTENPNDCAFVTDDKTNFKLMEAYGKSMNESLTYMKNRVFAALGVSSVVMGESNTSNKSTANAIISQMVDTVKDLQRILESFLQLYIFDELLQEAGYDTIDETNRIKLSFNEIDLTSMIALQTHLLQLYISNAITQSEFREEIGRKALDEHEQEDTYSGVQLTLSQKLAPVSTTNNEPSNSKLIGNTVQPTNQHGQRDGPKSKSEKD